MICLIIDQAFCVFWPFYVLGLWNKTPRVFSSAHNRQLLSSHACFSFLFVLFLFGVHLYRLSLLLKKDVFKWRKDGTSEKEILFKNMHGCRLAGEIIKKREKNTKDTKTALDRHQFFYNFSTRLWTMMDFHQISPLHP